MEKIKKDGRHAGIRALNIIIRGAKINFNESIGKEDKIMAVDDEAPFLVLIKKGNEKACWVVDFLLGERVKNYDSIPRIKVDDYARFMRGV